MLRVLIAFSLPLLSVFTAIGLLLSRAWGWSEYASDELYVVYYGGYQGISRYFIVNADGHSDSDLLRWKDEITALRCSPDGRTFAFFTAARHLYVLTSSGLAYDKAVDRPYDDVRVKNNQEVSLYLEDSYGISLNADKFANLSSFLRRDWLTSEHMYMFISGSSIERGQFLKDTQSGLTRRVNGVSIFTPLSPDGTKTVATLTDPFYGDQLYVGDFLSQKFPVQLTRGPNSSAWPVCFLTFRPQMLIAGG